MYRSAYIAKEGLIEPLLKELNEPKAKVFDHLVLSFNPFTPLFFMQNGWIDPVKISIQSIQDGIDQLKKLYPLWAFYPIEHLRRGELIAQGLRKIKKEPVPFTSPLPKHRPGGYTLLDQNTLFAAKTTTSFYPNGIVNLQETKAPPSRAYLKLMEALHLIQKFPQPNEKCLELGASPGSWTYVLADLGADVIACDRSPLDIKLNRFKNIKFIQGDAFKLTPDKIGPIDWLISDIICYPEKLLQFIQTWLHSGLCKNFICTIKFQGEIDLSIVKEFKKIEQSKVIHLFHNKHELTFIRVSSSVPTSSLESN